MAFQIVLMTFLKIIGLSWPKWPTKKNYVRPSVRVPPRAKTICRRDLGVVSLHSLVNTGVSSQRGPKKKIRPKMAKKIFFGQKFFFSNLIIVEYFKKKKCI